MRSSESQYTTRLISTDLTSTNLPPRDNNLYVQLLSFFSNFCMNHLQSLIPYPRGLRQYPRYLNPEVRGSILKGRKLHILCLIVSSMSLNRKYDLATLISIHVAEQKVSRISLQCCYSSIVPMPNRTPLKISNETKVNLSHQKISS